MVKSEELVGLNKIQFWNKQGLVVEKIWLGSFLGPEFDKYVEDSGF